MKKIILTILLLTLNAQAQQNHTGPENMIYKGCEIKDVESKLTDLMYSELTVELERQDIKWVPNSLTVTQQNDFTNYNGYSSPLYSVTVQTQAGNQLAVMSKQVLGPSAQGVMFSDFPYLMLERDNEGVIKKATCWLPFDVMSDMYLVNKTLGVRLSRIYSRGIEIDLPLK